METVILALISISFILRFTGIILILYFCCLLNTIAKRMKNENDDSLVKEDNNMKISFINRGEDSLNVTFGGKRSTTHQHTENDDNFNNEVFSKAKAVSSNNVNAYNSNIIESFKNNLDFVNNNEQVIYLKLNFRNILMIRSLKLIWLCLKNLKLRNSRKNEFFL